MECPTVEFKIMVNGEREGWRSFDEEHLAYSTHYNRPDDAPGGDDLMLMFFTSGTSGYPKIAAHNYKYPLGHFVTARYWHQVDPDGLHFSISDTGWAKSMWGKLYGQWLCEAAIFVYDFDRFHADNILPLFAKHNITTFCAPPTMLRMMIKEDLSKYDLSSVKHMTTAGEALNPEVYRRFLEATGLSIMEGFGQTEGTVLVANTVGMTPRLGSMGKPVASYDIDIFDAEGKPCAVGDSGEICIRLDKGHPCGLVQEYYGNKEKTDEVFRGGLYHTGDVAYKDEEGYFWYVSRIDDVIKSSGYRIGPFEIENVIMELPYVLECGVSAEPDPLRGQVVKASLFHVGAFAMGTMTIHAQRPHGKIYPAPRHAHNLPGGAYGCADGEWIYIGLGDRKKTVPALYKMIGHPDLGEDPRFQPGQIRENMEAYYTVFKEALLKKPSDYWTAQAKELDIPIVRMNHFADVSEDEQAWANGYVEKMVYSTGNENVVPTSPIEMESVGVVKTQPTKPVGCDTAKVLSELGFTPEEIQNLHNDGIVLAAE